MLKEQPGMLIRLLIFLLLAACTPQTAEDGADGSPGKRGLLLETFTAAGQVIYLPVQPPSEASMAALIEGRLAEVNGCLRIEDSHYADGWLVIWPSGSAVQAADSGIEILNEAGTPVARVGERLRAGGGALENAVSMAELDETIPGMPIAGCPGPYWVAAPLETLVQQAVPDIYFEPFSSDGQILAWFVYQSRSSPEKEMLSGELALDEKRCLRLKEYLLILPPDTYLREDPLRLVDGDLEPIAQIGEAVQVTGAERKAGDYRYFDNKVQCAGPYWGVNQITAAE